MIVQTSFYHSCGSNVAPTENANWLNILDKCATKCVSHSLNILCFLYKFLPFNKNSTTTLTLVLMHYLCDPVKKSANSQCSILILSIPFSNSAETCNLVSWQTWTSQTITEAMR